VRHVRRRGVIATLITNRHLLTPVMIQRLNGAGLDSLRPLLLAAARASSDPAGGLLGGRSR
jgi:hypothetical protein